MPKTFVLSVGGSLIVPNGNIDTKFLKGFRDLILKEIKHGHKFVIVSGGGMTARHYQNAANKVAKLTREDVDWLGIHATRLNGHLLRTIFRDVAYKKMYKNPLHVKKTQKSVVVVAGWKPGWSTDYVATRVAANIGTDTVINLSNIDYVYDKDPGKYTSAKAVSKLSWKDYRKQVGNKWDPGMNLPFDPVASKLAQEKGIKVVIANGKKFANFSKIIHGEKFKGTVISHS